MQTIPALILSFAFLCSFASAADPSRLLHSSLNSLLDECLHNGAQLSQDCNYFINEYRWKCDEIEGVFNYTITLPPSQHRVPGRKLLKDKLLNLLQTPSFPVNCLGKDPIQLAIKSNDEDFALAVWDKRKGQNWSQYHSIWCSSLLDQLVKKNMLTLLQKIFSEHTTCLADFSQSFPVAADLLMDRAVDLNSTRMITQVHNMGATLSGRHLIQAYQSEYNHIVQWAFSENLVNFTPERTIDFLRVLRIAVTLNDFKVCSTILGYDIDVGALQEVAKVCNAMGGWNFSLGYLEDWIEAHLQPN